MALRCLPVAAPGSLLKGTAAPKAKKGETTKPVRERDAGHLEALRQCPCVACGHDPAGEAAHISMASAKHGKPEKGMGSKSADQWTLPLCHACHMRSHEVGEQPFWRDLGLDPLMLAAALYRASSNIEAMRAMVFAVGPR